MLARAVATYYHISRNDEIAPLPARLSDALTPARPSCQAGEPSTCPPRNPRRYVEAIVDGESNSVAAALLGTRHATQLAAACTIGGGELDDQDARTALLQATTGHTGSAA